MKFSLELNVAKNTHYIKKASNKSCSELNFVHKIPRAHMSISPQSWTRAYKDQYIWNLIIYMNGKLGSAECYEKYWLYEKPLQTKIIQNKIF